MTEPRLDAIRRGLALFARRDAAGKSPLYAHLAEHAAEDPEIAGLLTAARSEFAIPTVLVFFAAVHRVLQSFPIHELANYYPSLGGSFGPDAGTWPVFRTFVLEHADAIRELIATRGVQTNEVRRAALLYPAVGLVAGRGPIGLLEVGCSAGLLLGMDRYSYRYQTEQSGQLVAGPSKATVGLHCALSLAEGASLPVLPKKLTIGARVGLDRAPVDLSDEDQYAWLEACIWADQPDRQRLFAAAARAQLADPPELIAGDAVDDLAAVAERVPAELPLVVITSTAMLYLTTERQLEFVAALGELSTRREVAWVSHEGYGAALGHVLPDRTDLRPAVGEQSFGVVGIVRWENGRATGRAVARSAWHGERMEWLP